VLLATYGSHWKLTGTESVHPLAVLEAKFIPQRGLVSTQGAGLGSGGTLAQPPAVLDLIYTS